MRANTTSFWRLTVQIGGENPQRLYFDEDMYDSALDLQKCLKIMHGDKAKTFLQHFDNSAEEEQDELLNELERKFERLGQALEHGSNEFWENY